MTGLMMKDALVMRKTLRLYALFLLFYSGLAMLGVFPMSMALAMVEVKVLGESVDKAGSQAMTQEICALFQKELGVAPQDMYIRYLATPDWGWNGGNF